MTDPEKAKSTLIIVLLLIIIFFEVWIVIETVFFVGVLGYAIESLQYLQGLIP